MAAAMRDFRCRGLPEGKSLRGQHRRKASECSWVGGLARAKPKRQKASRQGTSVYCAIQRL